MKCGCRACLIGAVFDLPALAMAFNTVQYNGNYGCLYCTDKGEYINRTYVYPPDDWLNLRTKVQLDEWTKNLKKMAQQSVGSKECLFSADI